MPRRTLLVDPRFGMRMRQIREERGLSLRNLERPTLTSKSTLHKIETGASEPTAETARLIDEALDAGGELVAMVHPHPRDRSQAPGPYPVTPVGGTDHQTATALDMEGRRQVDRRHLLAEGALVAGMAASPLVADLLANEPHRMNRAMEGGSSDDLLRYYETTTDRMMAGYERAGPVALLAPALEHFRAVRECLERPQTLAGRRRLTRTGAKLGALLGLFSFDDEWRARSWFCMARRAATEADDRTLLALAMANESLLDYWGGREQVSLGSLSAAWGLVGDGGGIVAVLVAARLARAYAALGDEQALKALDDARRHLDGTSARQRDVYGFSDAQLTFYSETCYLSLGRRADAEAAAAQALELYQKHPNWQDHALVRLELASASLSGPDPDIEAAATTAKEGLQSLPAHHRTGPVRQRTATIVHQMRLHQTVPAAREFIDFVAQS